jgi:predicted ATPase
VSAEKRTGSIPETLRQIIELQFERLDSEAQRVIAVGSVAGVEFSATAVAAGVDADVGQVEVWCERLVRRVGKPSTTSPPDSRC